MRKHLLRILAILLGFITAIIATNHRRFEFEDSETDAIVVEALPDHNELKEDISGIGKRSRNSKQFIFGPYFYPSIGSVPAELLQKGDEVPGAYPPVSPFLDNSCITNQGVRGNCEPFERCYPLLNLPEEGNTNTTQNYSNLQEEVYRLSEDRKCSAVVHAGTSTYSSVCCDPVIRGYDDSGSSPVHYPESKAHEDVVAKYSKIVNTWATCGEKQFSDKIIGGTEALPKEFPWMVSLFGKSGKSICGGSLLDNDYVLRYTSADVSRIRLYIGDHDLHSTADGHHEVRKVSKVIRHKRFSFDTFAHDIALLKLESPVPFSDRIRPICLPSGGKRVDSDPKLIVAGWGQTTYKGSASSVLRKVTIPGVSNERCGAVYNSISPAGITDDMVCAGAIGSDSCIGDSGGPLIQEVDGKYEQVGIVSFGRECGIYPGVYTKVFNYLKWINLNRQKF